jgi:DNA-binding PadR family transcriptional regulator
MRRDVADPDDDSSAHADGAAAQPSSSRRDGLPDGCSGDGSSGAGSSRQHGHHGSKHHGRRGGGRRRAQRGDVRTAILLLLADEAMHGYQLMQAMSERTNGAWRPSPGAVYPTIDQLEDEGLATIQQEGGRRLVTLTLEGRAHLAQHGATLSDPFADFDGNTSDPDLREPLDALQAAARQVEVSGTSAQVDAAAGVLGEARRSLYLILAGESAGSGRQPTRPTLGRVPTDVDPR